MPGGNVEGFALDLTSGELLGRLSSYPDWNEGHQISPDGRWIALGSARGRDVLEPLVRVPLPAFLGSVKLIAAGRHLLSRAVRDTEREALEPWLLDRAGDRGDYVGQQLNRPVEPGWDGRNLQSWHPSGTRLVYWESLAVERRVDGRPSARLRIARLLDRAPTEPLPIVASPPVSWAPRLSDTPVASLATSSVVSGASAGVAQLELPETMFDGTFRVDLAGYSDDGRSVLDGYEEMSGSVAGPQSYRAEVLLSGCSTGSLHASVEFSGASATGTIESDIDGVRRRHVFCGTAAESCD